MLARPGRCTADRPSGHGGATTPITHLPLSLPLFLHSARIGGRFPLATVVDTRVGVMEWPPGEDGEPPPHARVRVDMSPRELQQVGQCPLPSLRLRTVPGETEDPIDFSFELGHLSVYVMPGAANIELIHSVMQVEAQRAKDAPTFCGKFVRIALITWVY